MIRAEPSSSSWASTASSALVCRSARSASRTRSLAAGCAAPSSPPSANVAAMIGAKVSTSGHMTRTSRGSRVGSSASRPRITSRSTSTWRVRPWQACTWTLRSLSSSGGGCGWTRSCARSCLSRPRRVSGVGVSSSCRTVVASGAQRVRSCWSSRTSRDSDVSRGLWSWRRAMSSWRRVTCLALLTVSQSAGEEWCSHRCTSRCSASAARTRRRAGDRRLAPKTESRSREPAQVWVGAESRAGVVEQLGGGRLADPVAQPAPKLRLPPQIVVERRAVTALVPAIGPGAQHLRPRLPVLVEQVRQPAGHGQASSLVLVAGAEVLGERPAPRLVRDGLVDDLEERPDGLAAEPTARLPRRAPATRPAAPRRASCSAKGTPRWRRHRRRPLRRARGRAAAPATARRPWPARRRSRGRTGRPAAWLGHLRALEPTPRRQLTYERRALPPSVPAQRLSRQPGRGQHCQPRGSDPPRRLPGAGTSASCACTSEGTPHRGPSGFRTGTSASHWSPSGP